MTGQATGGAVCVGVTMFSYEYRFLSRSMAKKISFFPGLIALAATTPENFQHFFITEDKGTRQAVFITSS